MTNLTEQVTEDSAGELREAIREVLDSKWESLLSRLKERKGLQADGELWSDAAALGWFGLAVPEEYGGLGFGFAGLAVLYEELGRCVTPLSMLPTLLAAEALVLGGSDEQKTQWLPRIAGGELRISAALPLRGEAIPHCATDGTVSGRVSHVGRGAALDWLLLPVQGDDGIDMILVGTSDSGVAVESTPIIDLTRSLSAVILQDVRVDASRRFRIANSQWERLLDHATVALALDSVGGGMRILERTVGYMSVRKQFGRPIGSFQALKHRAANWKVLLEGARALTSQAAALLAEDASNASTVASAAKVSACDVCTGVAGDAIQLHGGVGFTWEHECHLFIKRARLNAAWFGSSVQHRERVAANAFAQTLGPEFRARTLLATT